MTRTIVTVTLAAVLAGATSAQEPKPAEKPVLVNSGPMPNLEPKTDAAPQVSAQDKQIVQALDIQRTGYTLAIAALQEKLDAVNAELGRTVQRLQAAHPGYDLAQGLVYVKKPPPAAPPKSP